MTDVMKENRLTLNHLLVQLGQPPRAEDVVLSRLELDSRRVSRGDLFLALPGVAVDGRDYIDAAVANGAAAVLVQAGRELSVSDASVPVVIVDNLTEQAGTLIDFSLGRPSKSLKVIGVTGTNGKSSTVYFLGRLLDRLSSGCGVMGTLGQGRIGQLEDLGNTTSDIGSTHRFTADLRDQNVGWMAMEVSSHGLDQGRVNSVHFDTAIFTNLTRDHLDYHGSMEKYADAKGRLFVHPGLKYAIINKDDAWAERISTCIADDVERLMVSLDDTTADVYLQDIQLQPNGMKADIFTPWGEGVLETSLLGRFNLSNLLGVVAALGCHDFSLASVLKEIGSLSNVPGRMECYGGGAQPSVVIDYAHTSDALTSVLMSLREHGSQQVTCLFGCGGDRDRGKRALMAQAACSGADSVVLTSDNPRSEDPRRIIDDALAGLSEIQKKKVTVIVERAVAIKQTIELAQAGDLVLVAGKGHENYQEVNGVRYPFSDQEKVTQALSGRVA